MLKKFFATFFFAYIILFGGEQAEAKDIWVHTDVIGSEFEEDIIRIEYYIISETVVKSNAKDKFPYIVDVKTVNKKTGDVRRDTLTFMEAPYNWIYKKNGSKWHQVSENTAVLKVLQKLFTM